MANKIQVQDNKFKKSQKTQVNKAATKTTDKAKNPLNKLKVIKDEIKHGEEGHFTNKLAQSSTAKPQKIQTNLGVTFAEEKEENIESKLIALLKDIDLEQKEAKTKFESLLKAERSLNLDQKIKLLQKLKEEAMSNGLMTAHDFIHEIRIEKDFQIDKSTQIADKQETEIKKQETEIKKQETELKKTKLSVDKQETEIKKQKSALIKEKHQAFSKLQRAFEEFTNSRANYFTSQSDRASFRAEAKQALKEFNDYFNSLSETRKNQLIKDTDKAIAGLKARKDLPDKFKKLLDRPEARAAIFGILQKNGDKIDVANLSTEQIQNIRAFLAKIFEETYKSSIATGNNQDLIDPKKSLGENVTKMLGGLKQAQSIIGEKTLKYMGYINASNAHLINTTYSDLKKLTDGKITPEQLFQEKMNEVSKALEESNKKLEESNKAIDKELLKKQAQKKEQELDKILDIARSLGVAASKITKEILAMIENQGVVPVVKEMIGLTKSDMSKSINIQDEIDQILDGMQTSIDEQIWTQGNSQDLLVLDQTLKSTNGRKKLSDLIVNLAKKQIIQ